MSLEFTEFDDFVADDKKPKADTAHYRVIEKMTDAQLVAKHGQLNTRPLVIEHFQNESQSHIIYGNKTVDLFLTKVYSPVENWVFDTEEGGQIHIHANEIKKGIGRSRRRKIEIQGSGALVVHFTHEELENAYILQKDNAVFIMLRYSPGFMVRGNVKFACKSEDGELNEIALKKLLGIKKERVKTVAKAKITQESARPLQKARQNARTLGQEQQQQPGKGNMVTGIKQLFNGIGLDKKNAKASDPKKPKPDNKGR